MIKVVVAGGDDMYRAGVCSVFQESGRIQVLAQTGATGQLVELVNHHRPDVAVVDAATNGLPEIRAIQASRCQQPAIRIVTLAPVSANEFAYLILQSGVAGLLERSISPRELIDVISMVAMAESVIISPSIAHHMIDRFLRFGPARARLAQDKIAVLTAREREVLAHVARGLGNTEIAHLLYLSEGAIKAHISHLLTKLSCTNRVQAAIIACDSGMLRSCPEVELSTLVPGSAGRAGRSTES